MIIAQGTGFLQSVLSKFHTKKLRFFPDSASRIANQSRKAALLGAKKGLLFAAVSCIIPHSRRGAAAKYPGVAQLVGRLVWELEHQNGSTSRNVAYSPVTP